MTQIPETRLFKNIEVFGLIVLVGAACVGLGGLAAWTDLKSSEDNFRQKAYAFERDVTHRLASTNAVLTSLAGLHHASDDLRSHEFKALSRELLTAYPYIRSIAQLQVLNAEEREGLEDYMRAKGFAQFAVTERAPDGSIVPAGPHREVIPLTSIEPFDPEFSHLLGYDVTSDPALSEAVRRAIDSGEVVAADAMELPHIGIGYFVFKAIYLGYHSPNTVAERRDQVSGAIALFVDGQRFFGNIPRHMEAVSFRQTDKHLFDSPSRGLIFQTDATSAKDDKFYLGDFVSELPLMSQGRVFTLTQSVRTHVGSIRLWFVALFIALPALAGSFLILALGNRRRAQLRARHDEKILQESKKRFRDYAEVASDWFWSTDEKMHFNYISEQFSEATGMPREVLLGKTRDEVAEGDRNGIHWQQHRLRLAAHEPFRDFRYRLTSPGGSRIWLSVSGKPVFGEDGSFVGYRGTGRNITAETEAENTLRVAKEEAELANRTKSAFLANISHELRTPLNAIIGFSDLMQYELSGAMSNEKHREYIVDIHSAGKHLLGIINEILDLSKVESGNSPLSNSEVDVEAVVTSACSLIAQRAKESDVALEVEMDANLPLLWADERKIKQILANLLSNAVKFTPSAGVVNLRVWCKRESGYVFQVQDTGIGIALEDMQKALAPFQQIDSELNRKFEGTGLGLPLAKAFIEQHGGSLDLQSRLGFGTTVTVRIPPERILTAPQQIAGEESRLADGTTDQA